MYGSAIPRVMSKHPGPQPSPEISHYDCAVVNCTQNCVVCEALYNKRKLGPCCRALLFILFALGVPLALLIKFRLARRWCSYTYSSASSATSKSRVQARLLPFSGLSFKSASCPLLL